MFIEENKQMFKASYSNTKSIIHMIFQFKRKVLDYQDSIICVYGMITSNILLIYHY
jgi:hypothetical protein